MSHEIDRNSQANVDDRKEPEPEPLGYERGMFRLMCLRAASGTWRSEELHDYLTYDSDGNINKGRF